MGAKITIDSSTLMNKGLEVIEAHELFGVDYDQIDVVVHPQSVVHGMVEFTDGATIAQLSMPDMRLPIGLALGAPDRLDRAVRRHRLDRRSARSRSSRPTSRPSRASRLAYEAGRAGGGAPGDAQRGQRGRGRGVPRRADPVAGASPTSIDEVLERGHRERRRRLPTFWRPTGSRASGPATPSPIEQPSECRVKDPLEDVQRVETPQRPSPCSR